MKNYKSVLIIVNVKTLLVVALATLSTYLCIKYNITANFPLTLIATAVVFPIVFSIAGAYKRREAALNEYANIKGNGEAIYYATRDWLDSPDEELLQKCRELLGGLLKSADRLFASDVSLMREKEVSVYDVFSDLSLFIRNDLRKNGLASGEVSRCNQYLSKMFVSFEKIKHIYQYRTPRTLQTFSELFIKILPPLYGPYFAHIAQDFTPGYGLAYVTPVLFSLILVSLDNIQEHLENPFDKIGEDDIIISVDAFISRLK